MDSTNPLPNSLNVPHIRIRNRRSRGEDAVMNRRRRAGCEKQLVPNPLYDLMNSGMNTIMPAYNDHVFAGRGRYQSFSHRRQWGGYYDGYEGLLPFLSGSLSSRSRGGFNGSIWLLDGAYLAAGTKNPEVAIFNAGTYDYNDSKPLVLLDSNVSCLENGRTRRIFFAGDVTGNVQVCCQNVSALGQMKPFSDTAITCISSSVCDAKIVVTGSQGSFASLWDVGTLQRECKLQMKGYEPYIAKYHPFWSMILTGARSQHCSLYDPRTPVPIISWIAHRFSLSSASFVPGYENYIITCGRDCLAKVWDVRKLRTVPSIREDSDALVQFRMSPSEFQLQSSLLNSESLAETARQSFATAIAFNPKNSNIMTFGDSLGGVSHYSVPQILNSAMKHEVIEQLEPLVRIEGAHEFAISSINYSDNGDTLVTCANDANMRVWHGGFSGMNGGPYATAEKDLEGLLYLNSLYDAQELHPTKYPVRFRWMNVTRQSVNG